MGLVESFFKNDEGHNVTVNGDRYRAMITNFFIPELNNHDVQELWFQQDGATCHTARATIDLLKDTFGDRLISRFGPVNWPPRSCDLTALDYFLWGYVKSLVYADKPQTLDHLEDNIRRVIADIRPQMLEKVIENWTSRLDYIRASRGRIWGDSASAGQDSHYASRQTPALSGRQTRDQRDSRPLTSDILQSQRHLGVRKLRRIRTEEFRISNHTVEIEQASLPKLAAELPRANCKLCTLWHITCIGHFPKGSL
ncbi:putative DD41D transposase [Trichonephila clavipes]|nr:putative DD41D transposase [Trichonephila clavipes]